MIKVNFNPSVLGIQSNLAKSTNALSVALERMSTGYKINSAKDDAAGLYVATRLNSRLSGLKVASDNVANALSMLNTAESSLVEITNSLDRVRDLAVSASNGTYNAETRKMMQNEIDSLLSEVQRIQDNTTFNKLSVFTDTTPVNGM
jgi:flagellin